MSPLLVVLLTGIVEIGMAAFQAMQVQAAAEAGAVYAAKYGTSDLTAIGTAVTNGTGTSGIAASPAPLLFCGCPTGTGVTSQGNDCATPCAGPMAPGKYLTVSATITRTDLLPLPFIDLLLPATFTGKSMLRTQ